MRATNLLWLAVALVGCATTEPADADFDAMAATLAPAEAEPEPLRASTTDAFVDHAVQHRAELRASLERWRASRARIDAVKSQFGPLELGYGYYFSRVETRVGPQRHRAGVKQMFLWPGIAERERSAKRAEADVQAIRHSAELLNIRWEVLDAYWTLWAVEQERHWHEEHQQIAQFLTDTVRGRVEVGNATFADVGQAELLVSRSVDMQHRAERARRHASLALARAAGVTEVPELADSPATRLPIESPEDLARAAADHPNVRMWLAREEAARAGIASKESARLPNFGVGVDWIETGAAMDPSIAGSGRDAVVGSVMLSIPIRTGEVAASTEALTAEASANAAQAEATRRDVVTAVHQTLVDLNESARRIELYEKTLVPQAEAVLGSVRGAYETGQTGVAALLLAQNELLELRLELVKAAGEHERQWARLERLVGRPVAAQEVP